MALSENKIALIIVGGLVIVLGLFVGGSMLMLAVDEAHPGQHKPDSSSSATATDASPGMSRDTSSLERLNTLTRQKMGASLYTRYAFEGADSVTIYLNPTLWNSLRPGEQRQLCDFIATAKFMSEANVDSAILYVGSTHVGSIGRRGDDQWFSPALDSLK